MQFLTRNRMTGKIGAALLTALLILPTCAYAQNALHLEKQKIKAGLIYNFLKYTAWPQVEMKSSLPFIVCVYGAEDPFNGYLQPIEERTVNQRSIILRHVFDVKAAAACHMLFVDADEQSSWPDLRRFLAHRSVLTVGDFKGFSDSGGMIGFSMSDNHIQIDLNLRAVAVAHLRIYDSLRRLARITHLPAVRGAQ